MKSGDFDVQQFEANLRMAQLGYDLWERRRAVEKYITLSFLGLLAGAVTYLKPFPLHGFWLGACAFILFAFYTCYFLFPLWKANEKDKIFAAYYRSRAEELIESNVTVSVHKECECQGDRTFCRFLEDWAFRFHMIAAALILIFICFLNW